MNEKSKPEISTKQTSEGQPLCQGETDVRLQPLFHLKMFKFTAKNFQYTTPVSSQLLLSTLIIHHLNIRMRNSM